MTSTGAAEGDGRARLLSASSTRFNVRRKSFVCFDGNHSFQHLFSSSHPIHPPFTVPASLLAPSSFLQPFFYISKGDEDIPEGVDWNVGMVCVCHCVSVCFMILSSVDERQRGSLLCNLLAATILSHLCEPSYVCSFTHSLVRSFTFVTTIICSLWHFLLDLHLNCASPCHSLCQQTEKTQ